MANQHGKIVVVGIFLVATAMGAFSIWYLRQLRTEAIEFWGAPIALSIRDAPRVELLEIVTAAESDAGSMRLDVGEYAIASATEIAGKSGLIQMRHLLLDSGTFRFAEQTPSSAIWDKGLRFSGPNQPAVTLLFATEAGQLWHLESGRKVDVEPQRLFLAHFLQDAAR